MSTLTKEKRNKLFLVIMATAGVLVALWFILITLQENKLQDITDRTASAEQRERTMETAVRNADLIAQDLRTSDERLNTIEDSMARANDVYSWMYRTVDDFSKTRNVQIPSYSTVDLRDMTLFPKFPYREAKIGISGTALYEDLGSFLSQFENAFPYMRLQNLELSPMVAGSGDPQKLLFKFEIIALVKPGS